MKKNNSAVLAFSLVEVALSLGVAAFALIGIFGLLPIGLNSNQAAINQTAIANILTEISADLRTGDAQSPRFGIALNVPSTATSTFYLDESGGRTPAPASARYRVSTTVAPTSSGGRTVTKVGITVSWPAAVDSTKAAGLVSTFVGLDRN